MYSLSPVLWNLYFALKAFETVSFFVIVTLFKNEMTTPGTHLMATGAHMGDTD